PTVSHVFPPSLERCMIWPNQPEDWAAKMRFGSAAKAFMWKISQPPKCGPLTSQRSRLPSAVRMKAPLRVPTSTRTPLIDSPFRRAAAPHLALPLVERAPGDSTCSDGLAGSGSGLAERLVHHRLRFLHDGGQVGLFPEALGVDLVDISRPGGSRREPAARGDDLEAPDGRVVAGGPRQLGRDGLGGPLPLPPPPPRCA